MNRVLSVQDEFQNGDNVTATNLNNLVKDASFNADTTDNSTLEVHTTGYLKIKDLGVDTQHLAEDAVTYAKMQNVSTTDRVLGRDSGGAGNVEEISPIALRTMINVEDGAQVNPDNATPHNATPDSNGVNTTGGADGLMSAEDKTKLNSVEHGAEENVQSDWDQTTSTADDFIKNKPSNATESSDGLMSSADKTKLNGIEAGAEENPDNATPHDGGTADSDNLNTAGGSDGLLSAYDKTKLNSIAVNANNYSHPTGDGNLHVPATSTTNNRKLLTAGATAGSLSWAHNNEGLAVSDYTNQIAKASSGSSGVSSNSSWPTFQSSSITATRSGRNAWIVGTYTLNTTYPSISDDDAYFTINMPNSWKAYNTNTAVHYSHGWHRSSTSTSSSSFSSGDVRMGFAEIRTIPGTSDDGIVLYIERQTGNFLQGGTFYVSFLLDDASMNS